MLISAVQQSDSVIHTYIYVYILFHILSHYGLSQDIDFSSLCYAIESYCLSILYIIVCTLIPNSQLLLPPPSLPLVRHNSLLYVCESFFLFHK